MTLKDVVKVAFRPVYRRYDRVLARLAQVESRLWNLETSFDYFVGNPIYQGAEHAGFNGQVGRKRLFAGIVAGVGFEAIVETGTWLGDTAGYMATSSGLPVHTCEVDRRFHLVAQIRLKNVPRVSCRREDSREHLRQLANTEIARKRVFFYLDAHWYEDLPLEEELGSICAHWKEFVIMVDDFKVPGDAGYGFDEYGEHGALSMETYGSGFAARGLVPFFPTLHSSLETGTKRGCVVLARDAGCIQALESLNSVRRAGPQSAG